MNADHSRDDGYVVAEAAIVLPVMVAIVVSTIGLVFFAFVGLGLQDAVHSASRLLAAGLRPRKFAMSSRLCTPQSSSPSRPPPGV